MSYRSLTNQSPPTINRLGPVGCGPQLLLFLFQGLRGKVFDHTRLTNPEDFRQGGANELLPR